MAERYVRTVEEHQKDWNARFLLAYRTSTHNTTGVTTAVLMFGRELRLTYDLLFGAPPTKNDPQSFTWQI
jgi:hypothetical protein